MIAYIIFFLGLVIGSFISCVVYRVGHDISYIKGRSFCPLCKHPLRWFDNIPVLSFFLLLGKCRYCHSPISWRYPAGEILTGAVFLLIYPGLGGVEGIGGLGTLGYLLLISSVLLIIFLTDLQYQVIPIEFIFFASGAAILYLFITNPGLLGINIFSAMASALFFYFLYLITKKKGMGLGDVYLVFMIGLILGFPRTLFALYLAFLTGAIMGVILIMSGKKHLKQRIAFGPFLAVSAFIFLLWGNEISKWITARFF